jgi:[histone H3]-lysine36 N-trimethyltransferase
MMRVECIDGCHCGSDCQNQRFQKRQWAQVSVIQTEKKGFGLRANTNLQADDFIFEYVGEVIHEGEFQKRRLRYHDEDIQHFYFMSLSNREFVDATKKGNLGRFCNHSCNPNCYVDKWIVGDKLRMGIFAKRQIQAGEELVFNYNVDRYGADPQPCYCGEPNCLGFLGGKTQTDKGTKLSDLTIAALGLEDGDSWDETLVKKPRKRKTGEDDEEYVSEMQPRPLATQEAVTKVMTTLLQCKEKWIAVKLLTRIQRAEGDMVMYHVVRMHGYHALKAALSTWRDDTNVVLQVLDILYRLPRRTRNKIEESKIEHTLEAVLENNDDEKVQEKAKGIIQEWSSLETGFRIGRKKRDPNAPQEANIYSQRRRSRSPVKREKSKSPPRGPAAPTGPRSNIPQRNNAYRPPKSRSRPPPNLPAGWFAAQSPDGRPYYYNNNGTTTWEIPTAPAIQPPPPPKSTAGPQNKALDDIIRSIELEANKKREEAKAKEAEAKKAEEAQQTSGAKNGSSKKEKWQSLPLEKQKKLYENAVSNLNLSRLFASNHS